MDCFRFSSGPLKSGRISVDNDEYLDDMKDETHFFHHASVASAHARSNFSFRIGASSSSNSRIS